MSTTTQSPVSEPKQKNTQVETKQEVEKPNAEQGPTRPRSTEQPKYAFYVEPFKLEERPRRFLESFAAILNNSNYGPVLDTYIRCGAKCSVCTASCPVYQASGDPQDIPCNRSELLLKVYRRYFTLAGQMKARLFDTFRLTNEHIDRLADALYRCTACKRCKFSCPMANRPWSHHTSGAMGSGGDRHRSQSSRRCHPGAARRGDQEHLRNPGSRPEGHLRVSRGRARRDLSGGRD